MQPIQRPSLMICLVLVTSSTGHAQIKERTIARLIWQDASDVSLKTGDLKRGEGWTMQSELVPEFPKLDPDQQSLVQMQVHEGTILTGIRDTQDGEFQSGWVAIDSGVGKEAHGDHFHWQFSGSPRVMATKLDDQQGNPAHVYLYDGKFYLANDKKNGFTAVDPSQLTVNQGANADHFVSAGGGHITLAAVGGQVAYATWIDRDGDNLGRVDVVGLGSNMGRSYSFHLPSGGIHGATACSGKVLFAPANGVCWVQADLNVTQRPSAVEVHHMSLGDDSQGNPKRTGAFEVVGQHVLFTTGRGKDTQLCMFQATSPKPTVLKLDLNLAEGSAVTPPQVVQSRTGEQFALLFEENSAAEAVEKLHVLGLDPNRDGNFSDAALKTSVTVGRSLVEGHSGHHEVAAIGRSFIAVSNPGDGTISIMSINDWTVQATLRVGGTPTRLIAIGG